MAKGRHQEWITKEGLILIEGWARRGLTDEQICHNMGIGKSTLYEWQKKFPEIRDSLKAGKEVSDLMVENALFKRAIGFEYYEEVTDVEQVPTKKTGEFKEKKHTRIIKKTVPPDVTAQIFWLKNRRPDLWRDKVQYEEDVKDDVLLKVLDKWDSDDV